jgi:hypothetical protein
LPIDVPMLSSCPSEAAGTQPAPPSWRHYDGEVDSGDEPSDTGIADQDAMHAVN